jgi:hypothetical protein
MLYRVLFWALLKAGIQATEAQLDALEELIWKVNVTDGERNIELLQAHVMYRPQHDRRRGGIALTPAAT